MISKTNQIIYLSIYENNLSQIIPIKLFLYRCDLFDSCNQCQSYKTCSWCQGKCLTKNLNQCLTNSTCTSLNIEHFSPSILPINGETRVKISFNELINLKIIEITLADIPCLIIKSEYSFIECLSKESNKSRQGLIKISFENSIIIFSKQFIQYRQSSIISMNPLMIYEYGGQILHINGKYLIIGNSQQIFIGNYHCLILKQIQIDYLTCRLPSIPSGFYNISIIIDKQIIFNNQISLQVTPNPIVQDIYPLISFARYSRFIQQYKSLHFYSQKTDELREN